MNNPFSLHPHDLLACETVLRDSPLDQKAIDDVRAVTCEALLGPLDFPGLAESIVPGDHVVLAIDPNVPQIKQVVAGVIQAISQTEAGRIDVVLWDEVDDVTMETVTKEVSPSSKVIRHQGDRRRDVRYLAADESADPIYVNRLLVDADFVLPVVAARWEGKGDVAADPTGIYPLLVDSASRKRFGDPAATPVPAQQTAWLLGVQMHLCVVPQHEGGIGTIVAGTAVAIQSHLQSIFTPDAEDLVPDADLVLAVIDGDPTAHTWQNAARAAQAASRVAAEGATIVVWTQISDPIPVVAVDELAPDDEGESDDGDDDFPPWNSHEGIAARLAEIATHYRLMVHCDLDAETIEAAGWGAIENTEQLRRLSAGFGVGRVLRAAQFLAPAACVMTANDGFSDSDLSGS